MGEHHDDQRNWKSIVAMLHSGAATRREQFCLTYLILLDLMLGEVGLRTRRNRKMSDDDEIYVLRAGVTSRPYTREEAIKLLADGTIDDNTLVRIGLEGKVFPARMLTQPGHK